MFSNVNAVLKNAGFKTKAVYVSPAAVPDHEPVYDALDRIERDLGLPPLEAPAPAPEGVPNE